MNFSKLFHIFVNQNSDFRNVVLEFILLMKRKKNLIFFKFEKKKLKFRAYKYFLKFEFTSFLCEYENM